MSHSRDTDIVGATDESLAGLDEGAAIESFSRQEATGPGDNELTDLPRDEASAPFVGGLDAVVPDWTSEFLSSVQDVVRQFKSTAIDGAVAGLNGTAREREVASDTAERELNELLDRIRSAGQSEPYSAS